MGDKFILTRGMLILIIIILLSITGVIIGFVVSKNNSIAKYEEFEEELENDASYYMQVNKMEIEEGEIVKLTLSSLKKQKLVSNKLQDKCNGYVLISNEENIETEKYELVYTAYIKCGKKYVTSNYSEY